MKVLYFIISIIILALATTASYRYLKQDWLLYRTAEDLSRRGAWQQVIPICDALAGKGFRPTDTLRLLGKSYEEAGDLTMAIEAFRKLTTVNPATPASNSNWPGCMTGRAITRARGHVPHPPRQGTRKQGRRPQARPPLTALRRYDEAILRYRAILGDKP
jgi:tetratricopeptide (TPR) repeat protein